MIDYKSCEKCGVLVDDGNIKNGEHLCHECVGRSDAELLSEMIADYKDENGQVDEVLLQQIVEHVQALEDATYALSETLRQEQAHSARIESKNKPLLETLEFYAQHDNWWTYPVPGGYASVISVDKGQRARQELKQYESK